MSRGKDVYKRQENILPSDSKMQRQDVSVKDAAEANEKKDSKDGTVHTFAVL